jgi:hypothetical protein
VLSLVAVLRGRAVSGTLGGMFYTYLVVGFAILLAGLFLVPGWWKLAWVVGSIAFVAYLPMLLEKALDPINSNRIREYCSKVGATNVEIRAFPNHYGVHFQKSDKRHYAKCIVTRGQIKWNGLSPEDVQ